MARDYNGNNRQNENENYNDVTNRIKSLNVSVLPNKKAGFIRCDEYPDNLYFSMNEFKHNITLAKTGQNVTFYEADGFDKKKNKQVKNAVNIYLNGG